MNRTARAVLAIVFVGLLLTPFLIRRFSQPSHIASSPGANPLAQYGFRLTESAKAAGLEFVHSAPSLDPKLAHIMPQVASMGAAVSVVDVDRDGLSDLYVTDSKEGSSNRLFRNKGDGTFEDVAPRFGVADLNRAGTGVSMGSVWGDYDNDGFDDLLLYRWGRQELFHNDGGRGFTRVADAGLPAWANVNTAVWLDFDRDGRLDLFVGGYYSESIESLETRRHADDAGELRVREQRRPQVPAEERRRRTIRGRDRERRPGIAAMGARRRRRRPARHGVSRHLHRQ